MLWTVTATALQVGLIGAAVGVLTLIGLTIVGMLSDRRAEREAEQEKRMVDCILHVDEQARRQTKAGLELSPTQKFARLLTLIRNDPKLSRLSDADRLRMIDAQLQRLRA